jgi:hypothetical protein
MALGGHHLVAIAWGIGVAVCVALMAVISGLEARVDIGFLVGSAAATVVMFIGVVRMRSRMVGADVADLVEAIEHEPLEI